MTNIDTEIIALFRQLSTERKEDAIRCVQSMLATAQEATVSGRRTTEK